ncbi:diguanylate cyclase [Thermoanaerobacter kivui]|uniref:Diguanylate cyclase n=1 Tax=Thermoanaerobacter kivui TaxID=2325 RepID=A0A097AQR5_THEKI|nr:GGDEF domain-containing protein [Thermoanaerobacter kivui]AIS52150.1 diguanylate cyclase [Thermoanaerobacter kivui]
MWGNKRRRSIIQLFTLWFFVLALVPTLLVIYATAKYLTLQTVAWANRYLTQIAFDESRDISLSLKNILGEDEFFFSFQGDMIIATKDGLAKRIDLAQLAPLLPVEPEPEQIFAPKFLFGFGYQPKLRLREKPAIYLEDSNGSTLHLAGEEEELLSREGLLLKAFGLKENLEVSVPVPGTNLKVNVRASVGGFLKEPLQQLCVPLGGTFILVILLSTLLYPLAAAQIVYPLKNLADRLSCFDPAKKENSFSSKIYQTSELAEIASSFDRMALRVRETMSELEQKVKELEEKNKLLDQAQRRLEWLASYDPLTGVLNRRSFMERCLYLLKEEEGEFPYVATLMMDVDNFKTINDTYGHPVGDMVLKKVGELLRQQVRKDDLVGRYGGDEFVLFFLINQVEEFNALAQRIFASLCSALASMSELKMTVSVSMGGAIARRFLIEKGSDLEQLIDLSDQLLLESKRQGKKTVKTQYVEKLP